MYIRGVKNNHKKKKRFLDVHELGRRKHVLNNVLNYSDDDHVDFSH